ncbi:MAG: hypothetical protein A2Z04_09035 [Chloroflexi bacterium RBG_16_57_9]|nr:MAG: hypothetical protein A2Z04_09035 [Chloroflexi bacterium RBG_16_57_9]
MTEKITRRYFLRQMAAGTFGLVSLGVGVGGLTRIAMPSGVPVLTLAEGVVLPDPTLCIGCLTCEVICSRVHREHGLSEVPRIRVYNDPTVKVDPKIIKEYPDRGSFRPLGCKMCPNPECLYVCPADALVIELKTGARYIREDKCIACGRCLEACPFPVPGEGIATNQKIFNQTKRISYDPEKNIYVKCDLCYWRAEGPACVERCPVNIRIHQGIIKSDHLCLELPKATPENFDKLKAL